jgi:hypothetical protein
MANEKWKMIYGKSTVFALALNYSTFRQTGMSVLPAGKCYGYWMGKVLRRANGGGEPARLGKEEGSQARGGAEKGTSFGVVETLASQD